MLNRVEELAEVLEDQEPGCVVSAAEREINMSTPATLIQVKLKINDTLAWAMVDSGASENFISPAEARRLEMGITGKGKRDQYTLRTIDGSSASQGQVVQETIPTKVVLGAHFEWIAFDVLQMGRQKLVLGKPWLALHNPDISWTSGEVRMTRCPETCGWYNTSERRNKTGVKNGQINQGLIAERSSQKTGGRGMYNCEKPPNLPEAYSKYENLFEEALDKSALPEHKDWDHVIPLKEGAKPSVGPMYSMNSHELGELKKYIDKLEKKGFIRPSTSLYRSLIFAVEKLSGGRVKMDDNGKPKLRWVVDYQALNKNTIRNQNPLPRTEEL